jgi:hypothetical protein
MHSKPTNQTNKRKENTSCRVHVDFNTSRTQKKKEGLGTGTTKKKKPLAPQQKGSFFLSNRETKSREKYRTRKEKNPYTRAQ